ncbi:MAG: chromosome partitioning protein [Planctomycetota bacterium]|nr:MAG: chromosome partitioning protein [Planctomycetota bacterium]
MASIPGLEQESSPLGGLEKVEDIVAVTSGKGGVGKSTTTVSLAYGLQSLGYKVGIADCDIYGASIPSIIGLKDQPEIGEDQTLIPPSKDGIPVLSMGLLLNEQDIPVVWRGPMLHKMISQFLFGAKWGELDFLLLDLPPGTGDVQLTLTQSVPLTGALVVTTPQKISLLDAEKGVAMFHQFGIRVLGILENMSYLICPHCGDREELFPHGGVEDLAKQYHTEVIGRIPMSPEIARIMEENPFLKKENSSLIQAYLKVCQEISEKLKT